APRRPGGEGGTVSFARRHRRRDGAGRDGLVRLPHAARHRPHDPPARGGDRDRRLPAGGRLRDGAAGAHAGGGGNGARPGGGARVPGSEDQGERTWTRAAWVMRRESPSAPTSIS